MQVSDENLSALSRYLQETLNPDANIRRTGMKIEKIFNKKKINFLFFSRKIPRGCRSQPKLPTAAPAFSAQTRSRYDDPHFRGNRF